MDDLIAEFLTETSESLGELDLDLIKLEQNPNDTELLSNIFRLMHTIKGTCGFLGLPRLEKVAHHAENVLGRFRDGDLEVKPEYVTLILESIDTIKFIITAIEEKGSEPEGDDSGLIARLDAIYEGGGAVSSEENVSGEIADVEDFSHFFQEDPADTAKMEALNKQAELDGKVQQAKGIIEAAKKQQPAVAVSENGEDGTAKKESSLANQSLRVNVDVLENLMTMVSELVLTRNQLLQILRTNTDSQFSAPLQRLNHVVSDLQEGVMKTRMQPVGNAWAKLPRIIRDICQDLGKKIELKMYGQDTELDRQVLELIKDPLTHMVRNSADHGVEMPQDRIAAGKPETGEIILNSYHEGGHIIIEIKDDGKGLSTERITRKIIEKGLATPEEVADMTPQQIHMFIFKAGFSTADQVTSLSGRGVGMDVVRTNIEKIGGSIDLKSVEGKGSVFKIKIPLTLAIVSALIIESSGERFAIPQLAVRELVMAGSDSQNKIEMLNGAPVFRLRERLLPLVSLKELLKLKDRRKNGDLEVSEEMGTKKEHRPSSYDNQYIIVVHVGAYNFGIMVDRVYDTEEIVVKPVSQIIKDIELFSGNTILGDGSVIMILDPNGVAKATGDVSSTETDVSKDMAQEKLAAGQTRTSLLLFKSGEGAPKAVPLSLVARLEVLKTDTIEHANGQRLIQYRGNLMPLIPIDNHIDFDNRSEIPVLVFADGDRVMGLAVNEIIDIKEDVVNVQISGSAPGLIGTAIIDEKATDVIDVGHYISSTRKDWFKNHDDTPYNKQGDGEIVANNNNARRILLVDDSPFFRNMLAPILSMAGYSVTSLDNAKDAITLFEKGEEFDLVISDIEMPEMDGFEFVEKLKENETWSKTPVLALSSHTTEQDVKKGLEAGFIDHVAKFDRDNLLSTLNRTLSSSLGYEEIM
jgi:two-component system, chemotaxis family, sensor kinase CheA